MSWGGRDAWRETIRSTPASYSNELHRAFAAQWWGIDWEVFVKKPASSQAFLIAVYEANGRLEGLMARKSQRKLGKDDKGSE